MSFDTPDRGAAFPRQTGRRDVLVIGGGGSGVLFAANLSRQDSDLRVRVIEGRHLLGCGIACSTTDSDHLQKTRICNKGSFPKDEGHFLRWLQGQPDGAHYATAALTAGPPVAAICPAFCRRGRLRGGCCA